MLSLVNYGNSGSEDEITDEEDAEIVIKPQNIKNILEIDDLELDLSTSKIHNSLPRPISKTINILAVEEADDEFLLKKAIPTVLPDSKKKDKVKISFPSLSSFKEFEEEKKIKTPTAQNKVSGLLGMLPKPNSLLFLKPKKTTSVPVTKTSTSTVSKPEIMKSVGLIPYSVMNKNKVAAVDEKKKKIQKTNDDDNNSSDDEAPTSFFSFSTGEDDLPKVSENEINDMVAKQTARMENLKKQGEEQETYIEETPEPSGSQQQEPEFDQQAMQALLGGNRAKRMKTDNIQFIDLSAKDLTDRDEWLRKTIRGETEYQPTGNISEKGPNQLAKRKHQISFLSMRAENNEAELEAMWASNRSSKRESKSKYGF
ncbi:unnamed protein product [Diamesa serratosioi]